jgi:hypothetical protein
MQQEKDYFKPCLFAPFYSPRKSAMMKAVRYTINRFGEIMAKIVPRTTYSDAQRELLRNFAERYMWWKLPSEALLYPERILAQVMNLGTYDDLRRLVTTFGYEQLRQVLGNAEPGWFNERSWFFWHYRLGMATLEKAPPPLPVRVIPA